MDGIDFLRLYRKNPQNYLPMISHYKWIFPERVEDEYNSQVNIGWNCGLIDEKRPYFCELWAQSGITMLTVFLSSNGIEEMNAEQVNALLEHAHVYHRLDSTELPHVMQFSDTDGNPYFSVNAWVGVEDEPARISNDSVFYPFYPLNELNKRSNRKRSGSK